ncbi:MAG TPA: ABC transporter permease subunit [Acidimicrobiia bacterium]
MATTVEQERPEAASTEEALLRQRLRRERINKLVFRFLGYVFFLGIWEFASGRILEEALIPGPTRVAQTIGDIWGRGDVPDAFRATLLRIFVGFTISFLIGAIIGIISQNRWLEGFFKDAVLVSLTAPGLIWALITAIVFGNREIGPIIAIVLTTFALVTVNVSEGIRALPKDLVDMGKAFDVGLLRRNRHIVIPHLAPYLFTGLRFGFSIAWKVTVLTEVFSSSRGIGFEMRLATQLFQTDEFLAWVLMFFFFALFLEKVVLQAFERRFFRWRQEVAAA